MAEGLSTWQEILSQPQTWQSTLDSFSDRKNSFDKFLDRAVFDHVLAIGCGSTHYLSQIAKGLITQYTDILAHASPASELWFYPNKCASSRTMLVAISRSGTTTETIKAMESFQETSGGMVLAITCCPESPLAQGADFVLASPDAHEESIAQTRSFTSMLILAQCLASTLAHDEARLKRLHRLPRVLEEVLERIGQLPQQLGEDLTIESIFFLGSGPLYGLANEAMLKAKEMSLSYSEAYHPMEFRHGPMSMVSEKALVIGLFSDTGLAHELRVLEHMQRLGARTLAILEDAKVFTDWKPDYVVQLKSGLGEWERSPLFLPVLQRMAFHRARAKGLDPDHPMNLTAVVELKNN